MATETMSTNELPVRKPRKKKWTLLLAVTTIILFALVGLVVQQLVESNGLGSVSESANAFANKMRVVRPLLLFIAFCFWQPIVDFVSRVGLLTGGQASTILQKRNRFFLWVALFEVIVGQGQVVIGVIILVSILAYPWIEKAIWGGSS